MIVKEDFVIVCDVLTTIYVALICAFKLFLSKKLIWLEPDLFQIGLVYLTFCEKW